MIKLYIISFWVVIGFVIAGVVQSLAPKELDALLRYSFPFTFAMFSLNFSAISACSNALLKYKEMHQDKDIDSVVDEMKENMIAMLVGIIIVFFASLLKSMDECVKLTVICNGFIFAVLVMYLHLILNITIGFFNIVKK